MGGGLRIQLLLRYKSGEKEQDSGGYCTLNRYCCKITRYKCDCPVSKNDHVTCVVVIIEFACPLLFLLLTLHLFLDKADKVETKRS